ncbi:MAG TPA: hypothetical protein VFT29_09260, partial [Gemmatimonadaceae bacterium]|nr:hypothetical protein [Gemmatimonadaceae bacterium]
MTHSPRSSNQPRRAQLAAFLGAAMVLWACREREPEAPRAEFIVAAGDSTYWIRSDGGSIKLRGSPMVLARLDGRFRELYVVDDDRSFEDAVFVGQRLYQRDLVSGDSTEIFRDTLVGALADRYGKKHPEARRLAPDEDPGEEPALSATADISVLGALGPFLSIEYHVDTSGTGDETWHMTRHTVVDLRTSRPASLADILGPAEAASVLSRARKLYQETIDSIRHDTRPVAQRAAQSLAHFHFDPSSFA